MNKEKILKAFSDFLDDYKPELELENTNFRIPSAGWKIVSEDFLVNPKGDVWEIIEGKYKGEQLFTYDSAIRETRKIGKIIPNKDELKKLLENNNYFKTMPLIGTRNSTAGTLNSQGTYGYYWVSTISGTHAYTLGFYSSAVFPAYTTNRANGFSVRCLKS
jgi:hypothetical protein